MRALRQHKEKKQQRILSDRMPTQFVESVPRQTCHFQVEGQTFPSHLKQNKGTGNGIRSLCSRTRWGNLKFRFQHGPFTKRFRPVVTRVPAVVLSISRFSRLAATRARIFALNKLTTEGAGTYSHFRPASSENVLVNLLLLHCGHCLWDWTFPHGSRKQQTDVCTD